VANFFCKASAGSRLSLVVAALVLLATAEIALAKTGQKRVVVLYSTRRDAQIAIVGDREIPNILKNAVPDELDYYAEHIDMSRFRDSTYPAVVHEFLLTKYKGLQFDVVIAIGDEMLRFVETNRRDLFRDAAVVFFATDPNTRRIVNSTGLIAAANLADTVTLATQLQPDVQHVFLVSGAEVGDQAMDALARLQLRPFEGRLTVTSLSGLPAQELETRVATLPPHSMVYFLLVSQDAAGERFHPLEYVDRLTAVANAPTYSWVDSTIGHGVIGGSLKDQTRETRALASLAAKVLQGERADSIPLSKVDLNVRKVDWRGLRQWGISDARIPAGTRVLFREATGWERYRGYILAVTSLMFAQGLLIAGLLVQRSRRRRAEMQLRRSEAELRASYERIRDLGGRLISAQEAERSRVARELHDDVSQRMALLCIDLDRARAADGPVRDATRVWVQAAAVRAQDISRSLHDLSSRLHPANLYLIGLPTAITRLQRDYSRADLRISISHHDVPASLPHDVALSLYRIAQEALSNAVKHSQAHHVSVHLSGGQGGLTLTIVDDGPGFDVKTAWGRGLGLISINERAESIGGTLSIRSEPGSGTRLEISVPLRVTLESLVDSPRTPTASR